MVNPTNDNFVLILGGFVGGDGGDSTLVGEAYDLNAGQFQTIQPTATTKRGGGALVYLGGDRWLWGGGYNHDTGVCLASADIVDGSANGGAGAILATGSMSVARFSGAPMFWGQLLLDGRVLIAGGASNASTMAGVSSGELFDPAANNGAGAFSAIGNAMLSPRVSHTATRLPNGQVLLVGGQTSQADDSSAVATADIYHP